MRALVLGGTGVVGNHLLARLLQAGWQVDALSRQERPTQEGVRFIRADLADSEWLSASGLQLAEYAAIFHLAYAIHGDERYNRTVTVESVRILLAALATLQGSKPHFIYTGSKVIFGVCPQDATVTEDAARSSDSPYAAHKLEATRLILDAPSNVTATLLHPTGVYDETSPRIRNYRQMLTHNYVPESAGLGVNNIVYADDVAAALIQSLNRPRARAVEEYIINGETIGYNDWFSLLESTVRKRVWVTLPSVAQSVCRGPARKLLNRVGIGCPLYFRDERDNPLRQTAVFSSKKAEAHFSYRPATTFATVCQRLKESNATR